MAPTFFNGPTERFGCIFENFAHIDKVLSSSLYKYHQITTSFSHGTDSIEKKCHMSKNCYSIHDYEVCLSKVGSPLNFAFKNLFTPLVNVVRH